MYTHSIYYIDPSKQLCIDSLYTADIPLVIDLIWFDVMCPRPQYCCKWRLSASAGSCPWLSEGVLILVFCAVELIWWLVLVGDFCPIQSMRRCLRFMLCSTSSDLLQYWFANIAAMVLELLKISLSNWVVQERSSISLVDGVQRFSFSIIGSDLGLWSHPNDNITGCC